MAMSGEPIRLLHDSSIRDEIRQRLVREAAVKPEYDFDRGLARLRATIANIPPGTDSGPASEPPSRLSVTKYAVKGSVWRVAGVVGLAGTAAVVGLRAWGPAHHVARADAVEGGRTSPADARATAPAAGKALDGVDLAVLARAEAENLVQIRAVLGTDPRAALSLVEDGNLLYAAGGTLREEREANAVTALVALGRRAEAQSRARRFLENYPKSPLSESVRQSTRL
jgi:hypothetical protein